MVDERFRNFSTPAAKLLKTMTNINKNLNLNIMFDETANFYFAFKEIRAKSLKSKKLCIMNYALCNNQCQKHLTSHNNQLPTNQPPLLPPKNYPYSTSLPHHPKPTLTAEGTLTAKGHSYSQTVIANLPN